MADNLGSGRDVGDAMLKKHATALCLSLLCKFEEIRDPDRHGLGF
jgi:hypothetical protein